MSDNLPPNWSWVKLGDICETTSGGTPSRKNHGYFKGKIPWLKSGELGFNTIYDAEEKITKEALEDSSAKIFPKGTLLIALYGATVGRLAFLGIDAATNQAIAAIFTPKELDNKFLYWFLFSYRDKLLNERIGGAQPNISQGTLKNIKIPFPPLYIQQNIVSKIEKLFSELDSGVASLKKAKEQIKTYRQAVLSSAFSGRLCGNINDNHRNLIHQIPLGEQKNFINEIPTNSSDERLRDRQEVGKNQNIDHLIHTQEVRAAAEPNLNYGSELPAGWKWVKVSDVGEIVTGTTPSKKVKEYYGNDYPLYKPTDLNAGINTREANDNLSTIGISKARLLPEKSILVTCIGATIGKTGLNKIPGATNQQINAIIPSDNFLSEFIFYFCISEFFQDQIKNNASSTTLPILNKSKFESLPFIKIPKEQQQQIVEEIEKRFSEADNLEKAIDESLAKAEALRQSILKQAFEGRLVE